MKDIYWPIVKELLCYLVLIVVVVNLVMCVLKKHDSNSPFLPAHIDKKQPTIQSHD